MFELHNIKTLMLATALAFLSAGLTSCDDDDKVVAGNGISQAQWSEVNQVDINGETLIYEFNAPAAWTAEADEEWIHLLTPQGVAGLSSLRAQCDPNDGLVGRSGTIQIHVSGFSEPCVITLNQGDGVLEKGEGRYRPINQSVYEFMESHYLWNEHIPELILDHSLDYDQFLTSMLEGVATFDNVNAEDGHWVNGKRQYWYSFIDSNAPLSRAAGDKNTDSGLLIMGASLTNTTGNTSIGFAVLWCTPGSPADESGMKRGDFISKVNNIEVTMDNYQNLGSMVLNGNCTMDVNDVEFKTPGVATITPRFSQFIGKWSYTDPSIYTSRIITLSSGKKVAYLNYMGFYTSFDDQLIEEFRKYKEAGVSDLIIDLRYNPGGHVLSSTVLGTLVAGTAHKGKVYVRTTYNAARTAAGEVGEYKIGEAANPERYDGYDKITTALNQSLGLNTVYVIGTENTASASELVINGLRGLGVKVNLIGTRTQGKNVGMEGRRFSLRNYTFDFYPITFYCENNQGFKDYSDGFTPDLEFDDSNYYPCDFGTVNDPYTYYALQWINTGTMPATKATRSLNTAMRPLTMTPSMKEPLTRRLGGNIAWIEE